MPSKSNPDISEREELQFVSEKIGKKVGLLNEEPPLPDESAYLLEWYHEISSRETLTYLELESWSKMTKRNIKPYEAQALINIDRELRAAQSRFLRKDGKN